MADEEEGHEVEEVEEVNSSEADSADEDYEGPLVRPDFVRGPEGTAAMGVWCGKLEKVSRSRAWHTDEDRQLYQDVRASHKSRVSYDRKKGDAAFRKRHNDSVAANRPHWTTPEGTRRREANTAYNRTKRDGM